MKKTLLLAGIVAIAYTSMSQVRIPRNSRQNWYFQNIRVDSLRSVYADGTPCNNYLFQYDDLGRMTRVDYYENIQGYGLSHNWSFFTYDDQNRLIEQLGYTYGREGALVVETHYVAQYDAEGHLLSCDDYFLTDDIPLDDRRKVTQNAYDAQGNHTSYTYTYYEEDSMLYSYRQDWVYEGNMLLSGTYTLTKGGQQYLLSNKTYDYEGRVLTNDSSYLAGTELKHFGLLDYEYLDKSSNLKQTLEYITSNSGVRYNRLETDRFTYDDGTVDVDLYYYDSDGNFYYSTDYRYNPNGEQIMHIEYKYENGDWVGVKNEETVYDELDNLVSSLSYKWSGREADSPWAENGGLTYEYTYNEQNNPTSVSYILSFGYFATNKKDEITYENGVATDVTYRGRQGTWTPDMTTYYYYTEPGATGIKALVDEDADKLEASQRPVKFLRDGRLYIRSGQHTFTADGRQAF